VTTIYESLYNASHSSGLTPQLPGEPDTEFLVRMIRSVSSLPDQTWNNLPHDAQDWFTKAATARNNSEPLPRCPGFKGFREDMALPKQKVVLKNTLKPLKKKKGALHAIREAILLHPDWSNNQVYQSVVKIWPETKPETVAVNGSDIRHTIALAKQLGWVEPKVGKIEIEDKSTAKAEKTA
jgi:hypothetical protein